MNEDFSDVLPLYVSAAIVGSNYSTQYSMYTYKVIRDVLPMFWSSAFVATNKSTQFSAEFTPSDITTVIVQEPCFRNLSDEFLFKSGANMVLRVSSIVQPTILPSYSMNESFSENETLFRSSVVVVNRIWR